MIGDAQSCLLHVVFAFGEGRKVLVHKRGGNNVEGVLFAIAFEEVILDSGALEYVPVCNSFCFWPKTAF